MEYESDGTPKDLWDTQKEYNKSPNATPDLSKIVITKESEEECKKALDKILYAEKPVNQIIDIKLSPMAEKYKKAWKIAYSKLNDFRKKEIDNQLKSGKLSDKSWDTDFARQVASLAEK